MDDKEEIIMVPADVVHGEWKDQRHDDCCLSQSQLLECIHICDATHHHTSPPPPFGPDSIIVSLALIELIYRPANAVNDGLDSRDASDPSMEPVVGGERPTCYPKQWIVSSSKDPKYWYVGD